MELTSVVGFLLGIGIVAYGIFEAGVGSSILNLHGIIIVIGGTSASVIFHCSWKQIKSAGLGFKKVFQPKTDRNPEVLIGAISQLAAEAKQRGLVPALQNAPRHLVHGFLGEGVDIALDNLNNVDLAKTLLERRIHTAKMTADESVNVYRVASILSPMFGLIGTLLGIIQVLKNISDPNAVGGAMAVAISSALFGIALANILFVPVAGKLRSVNQEEHLAKIIVLDGLIQILKGEIPLVIEQRLWALLETGKSSEKK